MLPVRTITSAIAQHTLTNYRDRCTNSINGVMAKTWLIDKNEMKKIAAVRQILHHIRLRTATPVQVCLCVYHHRKLCFKLNKSIRLIRGCIVLTARHARGRAVENAWARCRKLKSKLVAIDQMVSMLTHFPFDRSRRIIPNRLSIEDENYECVHVCVDQWAQPIRDHFHLIRRVERSIELLYTSVWILICRPLVLHRWHTKQIDRFTYMNSFSVVYGKESQ